jgi:DNA-binding GntR family transcriptional regulator
MTDQSLPSGTDGGAPLPDRATRTYERLRTLIVHGHLAPGSRVVESEVARKLEVSRSPVRTALQRLQQEGFILGTREGETARPTVAPLTREDAEETLRLVGSLEGLAAMDAARLELPERARLVERLEEATRSLARLGTENHPDQGRFLELDNAFHAAYVEGAAGPRLRSLHDTVKAQAERYLRLYVSMLGSEIATSVAEHREIIEGIRTGAPGRARDAVCRNWWNAAERLGRVIDSAGERGTW